MGKYKDYGKEFDERRKRTEDTIKFLRNIVEKGIYGDRDPKRCHHPIKITVPLMKIGDKRYFAVRCRDCSKTFEIFSK